jgi:membrane protein
VNSRKAPPSGRRRWAGRLKSWNNRLERFRAFRLLKRTFLEFGADEAADRAGAVAYYAILSIFPLLLGLVSLLGFFLPTEMVRDTISVALNRALPGSANLVEQNLDNIIQLRGTTGLFSLLALIWSGSSLFGAIGRAVNHAWDLTRKRNFVVRKLRDIGMVLLTGLLFLLSMAASAAVHFIGGLDATQYYWTVSVGSRAVAFLLALLVFLLIYKYVPNRPTTWRMAWPGALIAAVFFEAGRFLFIFYLASFANYEMVYGSLASVIILFFWVYISAVIMLLGVEFNSELYRMARGIKRGGGGPATGGEAGRA